MKKRLSILGSTGSIGTQTLSVAEALSLPVVALAALHNDSILEQQARKFRPQMVAMANEAAARRLRVRLRDTGIPVLSGKAGVMACATAADADTVVTAMVGIAGLTPTMAAIRTGKRIALANKETLVCAGELIQDAARQYGAEIVPVDSEHSAIFQCLQGNRSHGQIRRLILTASGGPFFGWTRRELDGVTPALALRHPNWNMGAKVTIDSATLMNKGLECIEAMHLFSVPPERISIVVHRESIIHSLVEYCDTAVLAQMGAPDMRLPIQYAITWPDRLPGPARALDLLSCPPLHFAPPDAETFPCLALALDAAKTGGTAPVILNGANEIAVEAFLGGRIGFPAIAEVVEQTLSALPVQPLTSLEQVYEMDREARALAQTFL